MIHWLVQSLADHPDLERGVAPDGLLSPSENARLAQLRVAKRRRDWLLGRWTAKHLLQATLGQELGLSLPLNACTIESDVTGAPLPAFDVAWAGPDSAAQARVRAESLSLSISHSGDYAFCALSLLECSRVGADIERIEARSTGFMEEYFTAEEIRAVQIAPADLQPAAASLVWSAKEAALKALHLGLRVDTRRVSCPIELCHTGDGTVPLGYLWSRFAVWLAPEVLALAALAGLDCINHKLEVAGWWQIMSNYVLTLVLISQPI